MNTTTAYEAVTNNAFTDPSDTTLDQETIRDLAYRLWVCRGRPLGSSDFDWYRAEAEVRNAQRRNG